MYCNQVMGSDHLGAVIVCEDSPHFFSNILS